MIKLYIARHAQVMSNLEGINFNNDINSELTSVGKKQANKLAKRLSGIRFDKFIISESRRTYETLFPLLKIQKVSFRRDSRINEANFGIFNNLSLKEVAEKYPKIYKKRILDKYNFKIPGGESFKDVALRWESFFGSLEKNFKRTKKLNSQNVLIITHATPLKVLLIRFLGYTVKEADKIKFKNASLSIFNLNKGRLKPHIINDSS